MPGPFFPTAGGTAQDVFPASQNITVLDSGSTPTTVYNSQIWYTGTPTTG